MKKYIKSSTNSLDYIREITNTMANTLDRLTGVISYDEDDEGLMEAFSDIMNACHIIQRKESSLKIVTRNNKKYADMM